MVNWGEVILYEDERSTREFEGKRKDKRSRTKASSNPEACDGAKDEAEWRVLTARPLTRGEREPVCVCV